MLFKLKSFKKKATIDWMSFMDSMEPHRSNLANTGVEVEEWGDPEVMVEEVGDPEAAVVWRVYKTGENPSEGAIVVYDGSTGATALVQEPGVPHEEVMQVVRELLQTAADTDYEASPEAGGRKATEKCQDCGVEPGQGHLTWCNSPEITKKTFPNQPVAEAEGGEKKYNYKCDTCGKNYETYECCPRPMARICHDCDDEAANHNIGNDFYDAETKTAHFKLKSYKKQTAGQRPEPKHITDHRKAFQDRLTADVLKMICNEGQEGISDQQIANTLECPLNKGVQKALASLLEQGLISWDDDLYTPAPKSKEKKAGSRGVYDYKPEVDQVGDVYVVTTATASSELLDIYFQCNIGSLMLQSRGGLELSDIRGVYKTSDEAMVHAQRLIDAAKDVLTHPELP